MNRRVLYRWVMALACGMVAVVAQPALAADEAADALIKRLSSEVLASIKALQEAINTAAAEPASHRGAPA